MAGKDNSIQLIGSGVTAGFHSSNLVYDLILFPAKGSLDAKVSGLTFAIDISLNWSTDGTKYYPTLAVGATSIAIENIYLTLKGDALISLANIIEPLFHGLVKKLVIENVEKVLKTTVPEQLNKLIMSTGTKVPIFKGIDYDFNMCAAPSLSVSGLTACAKGLFFAESQGEVEPDVVSPTFNYVDKNLPDSFL